MSRVGQNIKQTRIEMGLTQKQVAKKLGVAENFINDVELGRKVINEALIQRISTVLGKNINDIGMSFEEETYKEDKSLIRESKGNKAVKEAPVNDVWNDAFGSVLKSVPIYQYDLKTIVGKRQLPIISNKVEGYPADKVFFLQIEDDEMIGFRIGKEDIAFAHITHELENNSICLIEYNGEVKVRQLKRLDGNKILLVSNKGSLKTETVSIKDIKILGKLDKIEIKL